MSTPTNHAAWLTAEKADPLEVKEAPYTPPQPDEIVVRNRALGVNPADVLTQAMGNDLFPWLPYPTILGFDVAGTVHAVGSAVTRFQPGDRVVAVARSFWNKRPEEGAFQTYTVALAVLAVKLPSGVTDAVATVVAITLMTAAAGLFLPDQLDLGRPQLTPSDAGRTVLVWGAASCVGCNAVQLARAAGCKVIATAGAANAALVRRCGAAAVIEYKRDTVVEDLVAALAGQRLAGVFLAIHSDDAFAACAKVLARCLPENGTSGDPRRFIACANPPPTEVPAGIACKFIQCMDLVSDPSTCNDIFANYLEPALASGAYQCLPDPIVVGDGLANVQNALHRYSAGVSAGKIVVTLAE